MKKANHLSWQTALATGQRGPDVSDKPDRRPNQRRGLQPAGATFGHFEQRVAVQRIIASAELPLALQRVPESRVAWSEMVHRQLREGACPVSVHARAHTGDGIPPAFGYGDQAAEGLETFPPKELGGSRDLGQVRLA